ncbi:hypothetical protein AAK967_02380 [Atopobiaceae bacterium 24-176]
MDRSAQILDQIASMRGMLDTLECAVRTQADEDIELMGLTEASETFGIPRSTLNLVINRGDIPYYIPDGLRQGKRVSRSDMRSLVAGWRRVESPEP